MIKYALFILMKGIDIDFMNWFFFTKGFLHLLCLASLNMFNGPSHSKVLTEEIRHKLVLPKALNSI